MPPRLFRLSLRVCLLSCVACGGSSTRMDPAPAGAYGTLVHNSADGTVSRDPLRDELREVLLPCQHDIDNLRDQRVDGQRRHHLLAVIAKLVETFWLSDFGDSDIGNPTRDRALEGIIADRRSGGAECTGGTLNRTCGLAPEQEFGFRFGGPRDDVAGPRVLPARAIDSALEAIDTVLWTHHDSADWSEEERASYASSLSDLSRLCEQIRRAEAE